MPYVKKYAKKARKFVKKRYVKKGAARGLLQLSKDVATIQRSLNVEHKHLDFKFGSSQTVPLQYPTKQTPIIIALPVPARGTSYNQRVGNQIRVVHMTTKMQFAFENNTDLIQRTSVRAQILYAKSGDDVPTIDQLYELDANGHYTPMSMANTQEWNKYKWIKSLDHKKSYVQPTNRSPPSNGAGLATIPTYGATTNLDVTTPTATSLNIAQFYSNKSTKLSIRMSFENGSDTTVTQFKPYLLLRSDVIQASTDYDPIAVSGIIRMTYVDN